MTRIDIIRQDTNHCTWCGTAYEPRKNGGSVQRFCSKDCRQSLNTACRIWAAAEYEAERVSIFALRTALEQHTRCVESDPALERGKAPRREARTGAPPGATVQVAEIAQ